MQKAAKKSRCPLPAAYCLLGARIPPFRLARLHLTIKHRCPSKRKSPLRRKLTLYSSMHFSLRSSTEVNLEGEKLVWVNLRGATTVQPGSPHLRTESGGSGRTPGNGEIPEPPPNERSFAPVPLTSDWQGVFVVDCHLGSGPTSAQARNSSAAKGAV